MAMFIGLNQSRPSLPLTLKMEKVFLERDRERPLY